MIADYDKTTAGIQNKFPAPIVEYSAKYTDDKYGAVTNITIEFEVVNSLAADSTIVVGLPP